ncbi:MAG: radical SAM protein [Lachnospiraceae bacterium]|nr:radical SAM protein [Lachnospiraceae bacterium]
MNYYDNCTLCPRRCGVNRREAKGYCGMGDQLLAARAGLHFYEEPYISGESGSGTVFFSGCSLKCVFCQNWQISRDGFGKEISTDRLSEIFLEQQSRGALNINLVTGTHFTPSIAEALRKAKAGGLQIPVLWNSSAYEEVETLRMLEGLVDIWLPDFKTLDEGLAKKYYNAPDYPEAAKKALDYMVTVSPEPVFEGDLMVSGVNVRHLVMPGASADSKNVISYLYGTYKNRIWISIMNQYTPVTAQPYDKLNRKTTRREYEKVVNFAIDLGVTQAMIQEEGTAKDSFIPVFDGEGI